MRHDHGATPVRCNTGTRITSRRHPRLVRAAIVCAAFGAALMHLSGFGSKAADSTWDGAESLRGSSALRGFEAQQEPVAFVGGSATFFGVAAVLIGVGVAAQQKGFVIDVPLLSYFALWYLGNYYYNITNKRALTAAGGVNGFPLTIATLQLGVGALYALFSWVAPDLRKTPRITMDDYMKTLPVGFTSMGAHAASVFALSAGAVSFGQIVKAAEPAFAALVGTMFYGSKVSRAKWLCLIPVIGGVVLASWGELDFAWAALATAALANCFAAVKANENKKLMTTAGLKDRLGSVGNQFAISTINSFLFCVPVMLIMEGSRLSYFFSTVLPQPDVWTNLVYSGLWFYGYNELATMTMKKTSAVTQSVANTAKRVIVIVGVAIVLGESLSTIKLVGCTIGIGGVFIYSIIDSLVGNPSSGGH
eukprot:TRINITY_DN39443_c0_g1_i1.p1 TRINITY_DN39443_c0_g1~~TRINITY_DN39443_c0_g1_i1.p1  ORF type:complete len:420 (-),score=78.90 TRINITY_DN39443_c0_g1_i1:165-1424(-)